MFLLRFLLVTSYPLRSFFFKSVAWSLFFLLLDHYCPRTFSIIVCVCFLGQCYKMSVDNGFFGEHGQTAKFVLILREHRCRWTFLASVSPPTCGAWATHFKVSQDTASAMWSLRAPTEGPEGCVAEPLQTITVIFPASKRSCLLLRIVLQDALREVMKVYPRMKLEVCVDDITVS